MSDPTNNTKVEEPSNTEAHTETAPPAATEDATVADDAPKVDNNNAVATESEAKIEAAEVKPEGNAKPEAAGKSEDTVKPEHTKDTENRHGHDNHGKKNFRTRYNKENNRKFDASLAPVDPENFGEQVRRQVEFYFGDSNLPTDKFLWDQTGGAENKPVSLKTVCTFGRMRKLQPYENVVAALKESKKLVVSGEEGQEVISRREPFDPSKTHDILESRSAYVKGFGEEKPSTQFDIEAFFARYGTFNVEAVRMRRTPSGEFKGSIYLILENDEHLKTFLALDPKPEWQGTPLEIRSKKSYVEEKTQLINEGKIAPANERGAFWGPYDNGRGRGRGSHRGGRGNDSRGGRGGRGGRDNNRGRGRGGNGRGRDRRNGDDSNDWKARKAQDNNRGDRNGESTNNKDEASAGTDAAASVDDSTSNNKRAREEDAATDGEPPAKKADTKSEADVKAEVPVKASEPPAKSDE